MLEPLTPDAFAGYGQVLEQPVQGRVWFDDVLANRRASAWPSISLALRDEVARLPFTATQMERHAFSSQTFIAVDAARWIVAVAPHAQGGGPDTDALRAFLVGPGQGVTYGADVWHHPLTVLDRPARFAVVMWRDGSATDEEFVTLPEPIRLMLPANEELPA